MSNKIGVVISGPPGCGKSQNKDKLAAIFGKTKVVEDWLPGDDLPEDTLALTNVSLSLNQVYELLGPKKWWINSVSARARAKKAVAAERERCAKLCEKFAGSGSESFDQPGVYHAIMDCAKLIRGENS